jgi:hypothetical protein
MWPEEDIILVPEDQVKKFPFLPITKEYLARIGIPDGFEEISCDDLKTELKTVNELWDLQDSYYDRYVTIGSNGSGDPVAINASSNDSIVYLNHDNDFIEVFINTDIGKFVESVIRLKEFSQIKRPLRDDSFWISEFTDKEFEDLKADLANIDSKIFEEEESHWKYTIEYYLWEREEERKK